MFRVGQKAELPQPQPVRVGIAVGRRIVPFQRRVERPLAAPYPPFQTSALLGHSERFRMSPFQRQPMWFVELSPFQRRAERRLARPFNSYTPRRCRRVGGPKRIRRYGATTALRGDTVRAVRAACPLHVQCACTCLPSALGLKKRMTSDVRLSRQVSVDCLCCAESRQVDVCGRLVDGHSRLFSERSLNSCSVNVQ